MEHSSKNNPYLFFSFILCCSFSDNNHFSFQHSVINNYFPFCHFYNFVGEIAKNNVMHVMGEIAQGDANGSMSWLAYLAK